MPRWEELDLHFVLLTDVCADLRRGGDVGEAVGVIEEAIRTLAEHVAGENKGEEAPRVAAGEAPKVKPQKPSQVPALRLAGEAAPEGSTGQVAKEKWKSTLDRVRPNQFMYPGEGLGSETISGDGHLGKRYAEDGNCYSYEEFVGFYGDEADAQWILAKRYLEHQEL
jgi:hypothetical protein